jgi:hypothetical protein
MTAVHPGAAAARSAAGTARSAWCRIILLAVLVVLASAPAISAVLTAATPGADSIDQTLADFVAKLGKEQEAYDLAVGKAKSDAVKALEAIAHRATRAGDAATLAAAWKEVLRLQRDHEEATAFFTALGQLPAVLKELAEADAEAERLGLVPHPAAATPRTRAARYAHAALVQNPWETPFGGTVTIASSHAKELQFSGAGSLDTAGKIAILPLDLGSDWLLKGDLLHLGTACAGFLVSYDPTSRCSVLWYAESDKSGPIYSFDAGARTRTAETTLGCPLATWVPFSVARKDNQVQITIGEKSALMTLPAGHQGQRFGLITFYKETSIELANLSLVINPR